MRFIKRGKSGGLELKTLELQIFFDEMFDIAKDEEEVEWILEAIQDIAEMASEEKIEHLD